MRMIRIGYNRFWLSGLSWNLEARHSGMILSRNPVV